MPQPKSVPAETTIPPTDSEMAAALGEGYAAFQALVSGDGTRVAEWRRYTKHSPWVLRVSDRKRALFYARPEGGRLQITVLLGGRAVAAALSGAVSKRLHASIKNAKAYPEGRPVTVAIKKASDISKVEELIAVKVATTAGTRNSRSRPRGNRTRE